MNCKEGKATEEETVDKQKLKRHIKMEQKGGSQAIKQKRRKVIKQGRDKHKCQESGDFWREVPSVEFQGLLAKFYFLS